MIGDVIDILQTNTQLVSEVGAGNIFPIQRKQGTTLPCVVVDMTNIRTSETKDESSNIDFISIVVMTMADDPRTTNVLANYARASLDKFRGSINGNTYDIWFVDMEMDIDPADETFITVSEYTVAHDRTGVQPHT